MRDKGPAHNHYRSLDNKREAVSPPAGACDSAGGRGLDEQQLPYS